MTISAPRTQAHVLYALAVGIAFGWLFAVTIGVAP
jgi:hypothetical protein